MRDRTIVLAGVCTSSTGRLPQNVLTGPEATWAPMRLRRQLPKNRYVGQTCPGLRKVWVDSFIQCMRGTGKDRALESAD